MALPGIDLFSVEANGASRDAQPVFGGERFIKIILLRLQSVGRFSRNAASPLKEFVFVLFEVGLRQSHPTVKLQVLGAV